MDSRSDWLLRFVLHGLSISFGLVCSGISSVSYTMYLYTRVATETPTTEPPMATEFVLLGIFITGVVVITVSIGDLLWYILNDPARDNE